MTNKEFLLQERIDELDQEIEELKELLAEDIDIIYEQKQLIDAESLKAQDETEVQSHQT